MQSVPISYSSPVRKWREAPSRHGGNHRNYLKHLGQGAAAAPLTPLLPVLILAMEGHGHLKMADQALALLR